MASSPFVRMPSPRSVPSKAFLFQTVRLVSLSERELLRPRAQNAERFGRRRLSVERDLDAILEAVAPSKSSIHRRWPLRFEQTAHIHGKCCRPWLREQRQRISSDFQLINLVTTYLMILLQFSDPRKEAATD